MKKNMSGYIISLNLGIYFCSLSPLLAQPGVSPYYKAPSSFAGKTFVIPAGTTFEGRIESTIDSKDTKQGTPFIISVSSPVLANGSDVLIPAGAIITGEVVQAIPANKIPHKKKVKQKPVGKLRVQINTLKMPDGMTYPMVASLVGEEAISNSAYQQGHISDPVRGSGVAYIGTPTGFQSVTPGRAHYNPRTGAVQVVTKNEMLNDPIMGRERGMNVQNTAMRSLVKKNRNLFIYNGSPLTIRLEAPLKIGVASSAGEGSALGLQRQSNDSGNPFQGQPGLAPGNQQTPFVPRSHQPKNNNNNNNNQDSNF
jgi:hypothetical protein